MSQIEIKLFSSKESFYSRDATLTKVRKLIKNDDGTVERFGLSWQTGEWVKIEEGYGYPAECILIINE